MIPYKIDIKETSNNAIIKFELNQFITQHQSFEFNNIDEAKVSPLAQQLFYLPFVRKVYISGNFIAVERFNIVAWSEVAEEVAEQIENYLNDGGIVISDAAEFKKIPVTVYAESTPNPMVLKFVTNKKIVTALFEFTSVDDAVHSPLATELFRFPFVKNIFIDENYVSVTKDNTVEWQEVTLKIREFIKLFIENGNEVVLPSALESIKKNSNHLSSNLDALDETSQQIISILDEYIKPAVASDGGNIQFIAYDAKTKNVSVLLQGACSGCPSSTLTLKSGIENMLKQMLADKVETVEAING